MKGLIVSRTYHHGLKARARKFGEPYWKFHPEERNEWNHPLRGARKKRKRNQQEMIWHNTPSWFIREFMTVKQRARTQALLISVMKLQDLEEVPLFPHPTRPFLYYW